MPGGGGGGRGAGADRVLRQHLAKLEAALAQKARHQERVGRPVGLAGASAGGGSASRGKARSEVRLPPLQSSPAQGCSGEGIRKGGE